MTRERRRAEELLSQLPAFDDVDTKGITRDDIVAMIEAALLAERQRGRREALREEG